MDYLNLASVIGSAVGIFLTLFLYWRSVSSLSKAVRTAFEIDIRKTIERIERNKEAFKTVAPDAYKELFDVQHELEAVSKKFQTMFPSEKSKE